MTMIPLGTLRPSHRKVGGRDFLHPITVLYAVYEWSAGVRNDCVTVLA